MKKVLKLRLWQRICMFIVWPLVVVVLGAFMAAAWLAVMAIVIGAWPLVLCKGSWSK